VLLVGLVLMHSRHWGEPNPSVTIAESLLSSMHLIAPRHLGALQDGPAEDQARTMSSVIKPDTGSTMPTINNIRQAVTLNNGVAMPWVGLGTWQVDDGQQVERAVRGALDAGYRHIDTAAAYGNEKGVGKAVRDSGIEREQLFVTTKLWNGAQRDRRQREAFEESLDRLGMDYVDLYLIHWPVPERFVESWRVMEQLLEAGRTRAIGVSNFLIHHLDALAAQASVIPAVNQVEFHPHLVQPRLREACRQRGIVFEAWSPLMRGRVVKVDTLNRIGREHGKTAAQVVLRWDLQHEVVTIPKSVHQQRIIENADVFDFELTDEQMGAIDALDRDTRLGPDPDNFNF
jgi:diketogulonate reductase-like aldo/keto reductase